MTFTDQWDLTFGWHDNADCASGKYGIEDDVNLLTKNKPLC